MRKWITTRRLIELLIIGAFLSVLGAKAFFSLSPVGFLMVYGTVVTVAILTTFIVALFFYKDPYIEALTVLQENAKAGDEKLYVSCMIAVHNEERIIRQCIDSVLHQTYLHREIIVVDDSSTDGTAEILQEYADRGDIIFITTDRKSGKKRALSRAMEVARGDIFVFTDSDSIWYADAVEKIVTIFKAFPNVGAVSGHSRALNGDDTILTKIQDSWYEGQYAIRKAFESHFGAVTCVSGPLAAFRRESIFNFIPAWENDMFLGTEFKFATDRMLTGFVLGATTVGAQLKKKYRLSPFVKSIDYPLKDWKIVYSKSARSLTNVPDTFQKVIKQQIRWKKSFIRNLFFTGKFYWKKPFIPALFYYLHIAFVLLAPFIVARHMIYTPIETHNYWGHMIYTPIETHNYWAPLFYIMGISFIGFMFGVVYKLENPHCHKWIYRPLMSLLSMLVFSWLIFYSALTIRKMIWHRA